jgi:selenocysteine lyase/cysteine desulfurase
MNFLEDYFKKYKINTIGNDILIETPYGKKKMIYADWIAGGRLYGPIEDKMANLFGPMVGNTHSEASQTGTTMTQTYHLAHQIIKKHVNAGEDDVILTTGSGMTGALAKLQRIIGLKLPETKRLCCLSSMKEDDRPVVFVTHLEHHSNHTSWIETLADVVVLEPDDALCVSSESLITEIEKYKNRKTKIGSFSAGSNVTGIIPPYHQLAEIMHKNGGWAFVDFAASAPYIAIDMHPENPQQNLDAIFFSPHKMLGGPGSTGVLIFNKNLYHNTVPDQPGGGTVVWTNRWNEYAYISDIETREDGGTPAYLQAIRAALAVRLKEEMGVENITAREQYLNKIAFREFEKLPQLHLLAANRKDRFGVFSFYIENIHHNLVVRLLNDRFGVQVRGGCSCAGTYGHYLLRVDKDKSHRITNQINSGDLTEKPGWVRLSVHPTMTDEELLFIIDALKQIIENRELWSEDYVFEKISGEYFHKNFQRLEPESFKSWFDF